MLESTRQLKQIYKAWLKSECKDKDLYAALLRRSSTTVCIDLLAKVDELEKDNETLVKYNGNLNQVKAQGIREAIEACSPIATTCDLLQYACKLEEGDINE